MLESWERLVKSTSSALSQNKMEHLPLVGQTLLNHQLWRASNNFSSLKSTTKITISSGIASSCGSVRETLPLPYQTRSRGHLVRQTAFSRTELAPCCTARAFGGLRYRNRPSAARAGWARQWLGPEVWAGFNDWRWTARNGLLENYFNVYLKIISPFCKVYLEILLMKRFFTVKVV